MTGSWPGRPDRWLGRWEGGVSGAVTDVGAWERVRLQVPGGVIRGGEGASRGARTRGENRLGKAFSEASVASSATYQLCNLE